MPRRREKQRNFHRRHFLISSENQIVSSKSMVRLYTPLFPICNPHPIGSQPGREEYLDTRRWAERKSPGSLRRSRDADPGPFYLTTLDAIREERWSLRRPVGSRKLERKPGGERLHTIAFNVVP